MPNLPTTAESGIRNWVSMDLHGLLMPARTSNGIVLLLNCELGLVLNDAALSAELLQEVIKVEASSPERLWGLNQTEILKWARVIKKVDIRAE